jgi:hypothetical protein
MMLEIHEVPARTSLARPPRMNRRRRVPLRAPFVVTFATLTTASFSFSLGACGGRQQTDDSPTPVTNPPFIGCPASVPASGSGCAGGDSCSYDAGAGCGPTLAKCGNDGWQIAVSTCNPPPIAPCPTSAPTAGEPCASSGNKCSYGECNQAGGYQPTFEFSCTGGVWSNALILSCNPPPTCPAQPPSPGTSCIGALGGAPCTYGDCFGQPTTTASCVNSTWQVAVSSCNPPALDAGSTD